MSLGIYCYIDTLNNEIVYIGKDSKIDKNRRHKAHTNPKRYNNQQINKIIQNNLNRYEYKVLESNITTQEELNQTEINYISKYAPKFNFTKGGDGTLGFKRVVSEETKQKISNALKGRTPWMKGKTHSLETRKKLSESHKGLFLNKNPTIRKHGHDPDGTQRYAIYYHGNIIKRTTNKPKLEQYLKDYYEDIIAGKELDKSTWKIEFSEERKMKMSQRLMGHKTSDETKAKISKALSGKNNPRYGKTPWNKGKKCPSISEAQMGSKNHQWKDYPTIVKAGVRNGKQRYRLIFHGKFIKTSIDKKFLERYLEEHYDEIIQEYS